MIPYTLRIWLTYSFSLGLAMVQVAKLHAQEVLVHPYIQPGNASNFSLEQKVLIWQTDSVDIDFAATYKLQGSLTSSNASISHVALKLKGKTSILYRAVLEKLEFDSLYQYEVIGNHITIASDSFRTRSRKPFTRFAVLGDFGAGTSQQAAIAYRIAQLKPQFVLTTGDNVYQNGLEEEYRTNLFPYYLTQGKEPAKGSSLMNSIPFYMILGNHDVLGDDLDKTPGGFAYFYYNDLPLNGPKTEHTAMVRGKPKPVRAFKQNTKPRFPTMSNYSFDYGNVHITCLDANNYVNPLDPQLITWLKRDIGQSNAAWKIVAFHEPGFNASKAHYDFQLMRLLSPLFESLKVSLVLSGHVHNYQRSVPLFFAPDDQVIAPERVNGTFTLDTLFDGSTNTKPNGIVYIVTGAGGGDLYDRALSEKPELWKHAPKENWVPFTRKLIANRHSFTLIETSPTELILKQIDFVGKVIDQIKITR